MQIGIQQQLKGLVFNNINFSFHIKDDYETPSPTSSAKLSRTKDKSNPEEDKFLKRLFGYMKKDNTPIGRLPTLGCKEGWNLFFAFVLIISS